MDPEFGCEHLRSILEKSDETAAQFYKSYLRVHRARSTRSRRPLLGGGGGGAAAATGPRGLVSLRPCYACLHCAFVGSRTERDLHAKKKGHAFCESAVPADYRSQPTLPLIADHSHPAPRTPVVNTRSGVYCARCRDLVYDVNLERYLASGVTRSEAASPPRGAAADHHRQYTPGQGLTGLSADEAAYLASNTSSRSCGREGVRGLYNLGQTCYMNAVLQTLLHDGFLTTYFLGNGHKPFQCTEEHCLSCALCETFAEFNNDENTSSICSLNVLHASWLASPEQLGGNQQQDAHEFYQFLVDRLHHDAANGTDDDGGSSSAAVAAGTHNKDADCACFFHKAFYGKLRSTVTCLTCGNVTKKDDPIMDLSLAFQCHNSPPPPPPPRNSKTAAASSRTLTDCLDSFTAPEHLTYSCSRCGDEPQQATKQLLLKRLPLILCIQLKRFERTPTTTEKVQGKIEFPLAFNMLPYTTKPSASGSEQYVYDLHSVIVHTGTTVDAGHYYTYCRQGEQWFLFNDDKVLQVSVADVLNANAYLLFYTVRTLSGYK
ncbi:hypothetical protein KEM52_002555 [Ascosphaera acerosa]|nr:hypothetical protein KEM52_002555 [Ascosphaera acerosa]